MPQRKFLGQLDGSVKAGIELTLMDKIAADVTQFHTKIATALSFAAGIPGGLAMLATVPADIAQFYHQAIVVAQKIAYVYGLDYLGEDNDEFNSRYSNNHRPAIYQAKCVQGGNSYSVINWRHYFRRDNFVVIFANV